MKIKKILGVLTLSLFVLSGCTPSSPPEAELTVYKGSCHVIGKNVYFSYNGSEYVAKNQVSGYQSQSNKNSFEVSVIELQDGSFIFPNN
jgi:hypothetical protein